MTSWKLPCGTLALTFGYWIVPSLFIQLFFPDLSAETRALIAITMWLLFFVIVILVIGRHFVLREIRQRRQIKELSQGKIRLPSGIILSSDGEIETGDDVQ